MKRKNRIQLTASQVEFIHANYLDIPVKTLAKTIGVSTTLLNNRLKLWGLEIPKEIREQRRLDSCYKKGHEPFNKGLKGDEYLTAKAKAGMSKTWFKSGHKPHNTRVGNDRFSIRKDTNGKHYIHYKVSDSNWVLYHRHLWQQAYGKIPPDKILVFKDQDHANVVLDNLELISRAEHLKRNQSDYYNEPEPIKQVMDLMYKVTDKLNNHERK